MKVKSRLHLYSSQEVKDRAYIIGDKSALLALSDALRKAATGALGCEMLTVYADNGHDYEIFMTKDILENEWQNLPTNPADITSIRIFDEVCNEIKYNK